MTLPSSGGISASQINVEMKRAASAAFSMNGTQERALALKGTGGIRFSDFHGKTGEVVVTLTAGTIALTLESLFTPAIWSSLTQKRVVLPTGVNWGNAATTAAAISIGSTPWGGDLTFEVFGTVSGKGGSANGGVGGDAFDANILGASGQKINLYIGSTGVLRGGGGGGGTGGAGGNGTYNSTTDQGPSYAQNSTDWYNETTQSGSYWGGGIARWGGSAVNSGNIPISFYSGGWTYTRGTLQATSTYKPNSNTTVTRKWYSISRSQTVANPTTGGAGGAGGKGEGADSARAAGSAGAAGGTNAGTGGTGGTGGLYGASGSTGATGSNGNVTNGDDGVAGGAAGYGLLNSAKALLTNLGAILGRTE